MNPYTFPGLKNVKIPPRYFYMKRDVSVNKIVNTVCDVFGVETKDIKGKTRCRVVSDSRKAISFILHKKIGMTLESVGKEVMGGRDHTTIINCIKKYNELYMCDDEFKYKVDNVISKLWD